MLITSPDKAASFGGFPCLSSHKGFFEEGKDMSSKIQQNDYSAFDSMARALEGYLNRSLDELPEDMRQCVARDSILSVLWDDLTPEQRRYAAEQWDYQNNPANDEDRVHWFDYYWSLNVNLKEKRAKLAEWEQVGAPNAVDLKEKEGRIEGLKREICQLEQQYKGVEGVPLENHSPVPLVESLDAKGGELIDKAEYSIRSKKEAAGFLNVSEKTISNYIKKGMPHLPLTETGDGHWFKPEDIQSWFKKHKEDKRKTLKNNLKK